MATYKGKHGSVVVGSGAGQAVGELRSFEVNISANLTDVSRMGDDWTREESTQLSWSGSMEVWWDAADPGQNALVVGERVTLQFFPQGNTAAATDVVLTGSATISERGHSQAHDGMVQRTVSFRGYGALTQGTI